MSSRASAMTEAGMFLSQPAMQTRPSNELPRVTSSMESAMTSREMSEAFMPSVPMVMPSEMVTVLNSMGGAAGVPDALLDGVGDCAEMEVAGADLGPGVGDADDGFVQVVFAEADAAQVGAGRGAGWAFGEDDAVAFAGVSHQVLVSFWCGMR